ncbi:MAG: sensor histidine kinase [Pseudobdellovibrionaceae bacterium]
MLSAFAIFVTGVFLFGQFSIEQRVKDVAVDSLEMATAALTQTVWMYDNIEMHKISEALIQRNQGVILGVRIVSNASEIMVEKISHTLEGESFDSISATKDNQVFERLLSKNGEHIARVQIIFSPLKLKTEFHRQMRYLYFVIALLALFCSAVVFWATHRFLDPPLRGLVRVAGKIQTGDYEIETGYWKHEFSILFQAFAAAATEIQKRDKALTDYAENLEVQVQQRTKELDAQRMQMVNSSRLASLGEVSAGIAHEINNPLAIIQGKSELLLRQMPEDSLQRNHVEKITQMVKRISTIIKGLRTFAREGSKDPMRPFQLTPFLNDLKDLCHARILNNDIKLTIDCPPELVGFGREVQVSQILINLLNNSMDAIQELPEKWIHLEVFNRGSSLVFAVTDSGPGIPSGIQDKIMEPFFTTKPIGLGTGMGLSISIGICRDHGGDLQYISGSNHTRFEVILPRPQTQTQAA